MGPRVQRASGIPCALFVFGGEDYLQTSGAMRRGNANTHSAVIVREGGRSSIPETLMIKPKSRGVLDTRIRGYDSIVWSSTTAVIARSPCDDLSAEAQRAKAEAIQTFFAWWHGLLRRFRLLSLNYGGQVAPRNDGLAV
jgi:hypothetical protein